LFRACSESGHALEYSVPDKAYQQEAHAKEQAQALFRKEGIQLSPGDIDQFLGKVGVDTRQIVGEVEKISLFLGEHKSPRWNEIRDMVSPAKEATAWELHDAFGDRNLAEALRVTRLLLFQGGNPVGLVIGLESRCRELIIMKGCLKRQWCRLTGGGQFVQAEWANDPEVETFFEQATPNLKKTNPYRVGRLGAQSNNFGGELMKIQEMIVRAHQDMIETSLPQRLTLELLLLKILK
jgi:DNA polymerase III delta subunit